MQHSTTIGISIVHCTSKPDIIYNGWLLFLFIMPIPSSWLHLSWLLLYLLGQYKILVLLSRPSHLFLLGPEGHNIKPSYYRFYPHIVVITSNCLNRFCIPSIYYTFCGTLFSWFRSEHLTHSYQWNHGGWGSKPRRQKSCSDTTRIMVPRILPEKRKLLPQYSLILRMQKMSTYEAAMHGVVAVRKVCATETMWRWMLLQPLQNMILVHLSLLLPLRPHQHY